MGAVADRPAVPGIRPGPVTEWFIGALTPVAPPLRFELVPGGRSNLTYRVEDRAGRAWALRRPPIGHVRTFADHRARRAAGEGLVDALVDLHGLDSDAVGLGDLGRREGYVDRRLRRWSTQFAKTSAASVVDPGAVESVGAALATRIPPQRETVVVHGDYRLDSVVGPDGTVAAVIDWELCTLGDPLADLGTFLDTWALPADGRPILGRVPAGSLPGFASTDALAARYGARSGRDVSAVAYFMAFGYWRLACILQGVYARYRGGAAAGDPEGVEDVPTTVARLAHLAAATLGLP